MTSVCPREQDLQAFAVGAISAQRFDNIVAHLNNCSVCKEQLEQLDAYADGFVRKITRVDIARATVGQDIPEEVLVSAKNATCTLGVASSLELDLGRRFARKLAEGPCQLGRFELLAELGAGSFGYVFRANDPELDRSVAIKILRAGSLAGEGDIHRFFREAQSAAQLQHPGIVTLFESGRTEDDVCFLVTEYVDGATLETRQQQRPFETRQAVWLIARLADALQYAHEHDVIHRDIKPANIILDQLGRPHITDFGLAKRLAGDQTMTSEGRVVGTPAYMSPEQARGDSRRVDSRSDVYCLGVILYELLTGERPFQGNRRQLMLQVINEDPRPPRQLDDSIPKDLETICLKAMSKPANRRYQTAKELHDDLQRYLEGEPIHARPLGYAEAVWRWCRRNPIAGSLMIAMTLGSAVGFGYLSHLSTYFVEQTALDSARSEAVMFEGIRDHYSENIINRVEKKVRVGLDHVERDDTLPFPALYLIDVGDYISQGNSGMQVQLYGLHPWRARPEKDAFQIQALATLKDRAMRHEQDLSYYEFPNEEGRRRLRYAKGQLMKESCVKCHNESQASPKRDWKVGDLVGVLEVSRPLDREIERARQGLRGAVLLMSSTGILLAGLSFGVVLATRRRRRQAVTD